MGALRNRHGGYDAGFDPAGDNDFDLSNDGDPSDNNKPNNNSNNASSNSNSTGNPPPAIRGLSLERSFSTPNPGARGGGTTRRGARYNSITMPSVPPSSGFTRKKGAFTTMGGRRPRSVSSGAAPTGDEHEFMLVPPPTLDTRKGLDILLHTHDSNCGGGKGDGKGNGNLGFADALSKTEGVLAVLDSYAAWAVGVLRGKVGDVVREGKSRSGRGTRRRRRERRVRNQTRTRLRKRQVRDNHRKIKKKKEEVSGHPRLS
jgi:hypothetical protein